MIAVMRINGVFIPIAGVNQTIPLVSGGTVIINENIRTTSTNAASLTINAIHIMIPGEADIIFSSAQAGIFCGSNVSPEEDDEKGKLDDESKDDENK